MTAPGPGTTNRVGWPIAIVRLARPWHGPGARWLVLVVRSRPTAHSRPRLGRPRPMPIAWLASRGPHRLAAGSRMASRQTVCSGYNPGSDLTPEIPGAPPAGRACAHTAAPSTTGGAGRGIPISFLWCNLPDNARYPDRVLGSGEGHEAEHSLVEPWPHRSDKRGLRVMRALAVLHDWSSPDEVSRAQANTGRASP